MVFGYDDNRIAKLRQDFDTPPRELKLSLDGLIAIRDAADSDDFGLPLSRTKLRSKQHWRVLFDEYLRFEIETGGESKVLVIGTSIAVDASVLTASIRVDARFEADIRAVVESDQ